MPPSGYCGPLFKSDITHPITLIAFLIVLAIGGLMLIHTWF
jgi:hypothetical protein